MFVVHKPRDSVLFQCVFLLFVLMLSQTLVSAMASNAYKLTGICLRCHE